MRSRNELAIMLACLHKDKRFHVTVIDEGDGGFAVQIHEECEHILYRIIASWGGDWDHVSVSLHDRCPTWDEMCWIKGIFWKEHESVIQYHPAKSEYVNCHPYCLHLWKPQNCVLPIPPHQFVGVKE